ncbi:hypothetical protein [Streptomyces anulatus]|uniref:hypothetical protein n=1 Tax=Streptomyces anulatus TaxID=1892 RepID=UPI0034359B76
MTFRHCVVADLLTDVTLTEMELAVDTCQRRIIVPGAFRATAPLTNLAQTEKARKIVAGRTVIHVMRGYDNWGTYPVWYADPAMDDRGNLTLQIQGSSLESYAYRRKIRANLSYTGQDQVAIARALLTHMATRPEGDIDLVLTPGSSGVLRDRTYKASESAIYGERLEQLANAADGFEYMIRSYIDPSTGQRVRQWVWGYPTLGSPTITRDITQPGKIKAWSYPSDATQAATAWQARGDTIQDDLGTASEPLMSTVYEAADLLGAGWPLLDRTEDYSTVRTKSVLDSYAQQLAATRSGAVSIPRIVVHFDDDFSIDPNYLGDTAKFTLVNDYFPLDEFGAPAFSKSWRIVGMDLHTPAGDDQEERAELIFEEAS